MRETREHFLDPQNSLFCIMDIKKPVYTKCRPYMGLHSCQLSKKHPSLINDVREDKNKTY